MNKNKFILFIVFALLFPIFFFLLSNINYISGIEDNKQIGTLAFGGYNYISVKYWYCSEETEIPIQNILSIHPEVIINKGDQLKETLSASCWIEMSNPIKGKMKIAIGNHDGEFANIYKQIVNYHKVKNTYYSHVFKNLHFINMSTEHPLEKGSQQYAYINNNLEKIAKNPYIDWIVVHQHKPLYSTNQDKKEAEQLRHTYQELFQQYDVDLVISSHNQYYERTNPILYNKEFEKETNKKVEPKSIITEYNELEYPFTNGVVFLTVGTAGDKLDPVKERHGYYIIQESEFCFLNMDIEKNGKVILGEFQTNEGNIIDHFELNEA